MERSSSLFNKAQQGTDTAVALLELGALQILLQLKAGEGLWLASMLLEVLSVLSLLALPQLQGKVQLQ